ncbi:serine/threonine-protein kinase ZRK1-like [Juglans microcarpa x Juglans regia]|uniref:serine/threonine-protein kinase ZRK1-like n=1 Tax=Juglans microcarpa x Juglans regia TaxID=2249226 RepID=UPI001B7DE3AE|nr:serine/threonine-protein kinase ZRK1-like [Juglans microcarpa x Juglans regia]
MFRKQRERKRERERAFIENGSRVLEKLVSTCNGKPIPIRTFSFAELSNATNNFDPQLVIREVWPYQWYEGYLEGRTISIKKAIHDCAREEAFTDLAFSAKVSAHKNVLKLVGCCLETPIVILVYEFAGKGTLRDLILADNEPLTWESRLKMARESAHAISYLHTAFSRPIIHTDIGVHNIFIDCHGIPKLTGFSFSLIIPEGETHVKDDYDKWECLRIMRNLCPNYRKTRCMTEKTDVYCFGLTLLQIFTDVSHPCWRPRLRNNGTIMVDPLILAGELRGAGVEQQFQAVQDLAFRCMEENPMERPTMVDVTKQLRRIEKSIP